MAVFTGVDSTNPSWPEDLNLLSSLAQAFNVLESDLRLVNPQIFAPYNIVPGQKVNIPPCNLSAGESQRPFGVPY